MGPPRAHPPATGSVPRHVSRRCHAARAQPPRGVASLPRRVCARATAATRHAGRVAWRARHALQARVARTRRPDTKAVPRAARPPRPVSERHGQASCRGDTCGGGAARGVRHSRSAIRAGARDRRENGITPLLSRASRPRSRFATSPRAFRRAALSCRASHVASCAFAAAVTFVNTTPSPPRYSPPVPRRGVSRGGAGSSCTYSAGGSCAACGGVSSTIRMAETLVVFRRSSRPHESGSERSAVHWA